MYSNRRWNGARGRSLLSKFVNWWKRRNVHFYTVHEGSDDGLALQQDDDIDLLRDDSDVEIDDSSFRIETTFVNVINEVINEVSDEDDEDSNQQRDLKPEVLATKVSSPQPASKRATRGLPTIAPSPKDYAPVNVLTTTSMTARIVSPPSNKFSRNRTLDSFAGSLESIDSLAESYWDPDDASQVTPIMTNLVRSSAFFSEHVHFLRDQTQPRKVEVVFSNPSNETKPVE